MWVTGDHPAAGLTEGIASMDGSSTKLSPRSVTSTVSRLTSQVADKDMKAFTVIDQCAEASRAMNGENDHQSCRGRRGPAIGRGHVYY